MAKTMKAPRLSKLKGWDEAEQSLHRIAQIEREVRKKEDSMNAKIDSMKKGYAEEVEEIIAEKDALENDLELFCRERRSDFGESKTRLLTFGKVFFRSASALVIHNAGNTVAAIKRIMGKKACDFLHLKEMPNKEALEKLKDEDLAPLGCKRKSGENWGYEIAWEKLDT